MTDQCIRNNTPYFWNFFITQRFFHRLVPFKEALGHSVVTSELDMFEKQRVLYSYQKKLVLFQMFSKCCVSFFKAFVCSVWQLLPSFNGLS